MRRIALGLWVTLIAQSASAQALRVAIFQPISRDLINPALVSDATSQTIAGSIHATLFEWDSTTDAPQALPVLAAAPVSYQDDGKKAVIRIRRDLRYSDGTRVQAADFARTLKRACLPGQVTLLCPWVKKSVLGFEAFQTQLEDNPLESDQQNVLRAPVAGILTPDDYTLELRLTQASSDLEKVLASVAAAPRHPTSPDIGAGAFVFSKIDEKAHRLVLTRNPKFRAHFFPIPAKSRFQGRTLPLAKRIEFISFASKEKATECLSQMECDWVMHVSEKFFDEPKDAWVTQPSSAAVARLEWNPQWMSPRERNWIKKGLGIAKEEIKTFLESKESAEIKKSLQGIMLKLDVSGLGGAEQELAKQVTSRIQELGLHSEFRLLTTDEAFSRKKALAFQLLLSIQLDLNTPVDSDSPERWNAQTLRYHDTSRKSVSSAPLSMSPARWKFVPPPKN